MRSCINVVKEIDKKRLQEMYTIDGKELIKPKKTWYPMDTF